MVYIQSIWLWLEGMKIEGQVEDDEFLSSNMSNISNRVVYEQIKRVCCYLQYSHAAIMVMPFLIKYKRDFAGGERKNIHVFLNIWNRNMKRGKEIVNSEQKVAICSSSSLFLLISHYLYNWQYLTMARNFSNIWLWVKKIFSFSASKIFKQPSILYKNSLNHFSFHKCFKMYG